MPPKILKSAAEIVKDAIKAVEAEKKAGKTGEILESRTAPATTPRGGTLLPRSQGMYPPDVPQVDLPRQKGVDKARAEGKKPKYTERMQSLLDSPTVRKKVDKLIAKGQDLGMQEWYGTEPLRQVALDVISPQQYESLMAQLASASQRNPVDQQNLMGSYLYYLQQQGKLDPEAVLLTNKLREQGLEGISAPLIEFPEGYGSLAQSAIFERGKQIASGDIAGALPPEKKLGTFYRNLLGNLQPVTVDVNAVRGPVIEAGDPRWLTSKLVEKDEAGKVKNVYFPRQMVEEGEMSIREAKQRPGFWEAAPSGSEYAGFEDLWQRAARREGVAPAEAQALGWYGSADVTALKTKPELYVDNLERLLNRTAEVTGKSPLEVLRQFLKGEEFLKKAKGGSIDLEAEYRMGKGGLIKSLAKAIAKELPEAKASQKTQIPGTEPTYRKAYDILEREKPGGHTLDYGAGLGHGSRLMGAESFEPFPREGFSPTFIRPEDIPTEEFDRLVNLNVLNVLPRDVRDATVENIGRVMRPGGMGIVTTRGRDVLNAAGEAGPEPMSKITSIGTYQKGFSPEELREYLTYMLGKDYDISRLNLGPAGAMVRKKGKAEGGAVLMKRGGKAKGETLASMDTGKVEMGRAPGAEKAERILAGAAEFIPGVAAGKSALEGEYQKALIEAGLDVAGGPLVKGLGAAIPAVAGIFIGPKSKLWNEEKRREWARLINAGVDEKEAYQKTGTFMGADGNVRQEISDQSMKMRSPEDLARLMDEKSRQAQALKASMGYGSKQRDLFPKELTEARKRERPRLEGLEMDIKDLERDPELFGVPARLAVDHPKLFEAYPELGDVMVRQNVDLGPGVYGSASLGVEPKISLADPRFLNKEFGAPEDTMIHELQHMVQKIEGFEGGSSAQGAINMVGRARVKELMDQGVPKMDALDQARTEFKGRAGELYNRMAGEAEARAVEARRPMSSDELLQNFPPEQQYRDVYPYEEQLMQRDYPPVLLYNKGGPVKMAKGGDLEEEYNLRKMGMDPTRVRGGYERKPLSRAEIQAMMLDVPAGLGVPFAEAGAYALRGETDEAKESAAIEAALMGIPAAAVLAKPAYRAVKKGVQKAAPAVRDAAREFLESGMESGVIVDPRMHIFIGSNARLWDKTAAKEFKKLKKSGVSDEEAFKQTNTFRSPDGELRQEISDRPSKLKGEKLRDINEALQLNVDAPQRAKLEKMHADIFDQMKSSGTDAPISELIYHPELFKAYPELESLRGRYNIIPSMPETGYYNLGSPTMPPRLGSEGPTPEGARSAMLHEIQHAIQHLEGFGMGANPEMGMTMLPRSMDPVDYLNQLRKSKMNLLDEQTRLAKEFKESGAQLTLDHPLVQKSIELPNKIDDVDQAIEGIVQGYFYPMYKRMAGEAESRAVQARRQMSPQGLRDVFPLSSYDVPVDQLIVKRVPPYANGGPVKILERKKRGGAVIMKSGGKVKSAADMFHAKGHQALMDFDNKTKKRKG